ncbi:MAG TPA: rRNA adenine N-6-methyltransferase family protein, partial [Chloroflexota bacterium]
TQALDLRGDEKVLEVGTGSGYQTAILAELARQVVSIERIARLAEQARQVLAALGYQNVRVLQGNGTLGWPPEAPYDAIIVTAAAPSVPPELLEQLAVDGRLVVPVGSRQTQELVLLRRESGGVRSSVLGPVRFVPLLGEGGWGPDDAPAAGP